MNVSHGITTERVLQATCMLALVVAGGACNSGTLRVTSHGDGSSGVGDGTANRDLGPLSQAAVGGQCPDGYTPCGSADGLRCYDLARAPDHCGACSNTCAAGVPCQGGVCQQPGCQGALGFKTLVLGSQGSVDALGDFDGDGILDLIGGVDYASPLQLYYGVGDGTFTPGPIIDDASVPGRSPDGGWPYAGGYSSGWNAVAADLNGDGLADLVTYRSDDVSIRVRLASGDRAMPFGSPSSYLGSAGVFSVLLADFDADGQLDLVASVAQALEYWRGRSGQFEHQALLVSQDQTLWGPALTLATDWNGDGVLDLVYGAQGFGGAIQLGGQTRLHYRLGHGDGSFAPEVLCALTAGLVADLDHDHRPDLLSATSLMGASLLLGIDACSARQMVPIGDWTDMGAVAAADFNGDGNLDVVVEDNQAIMVHVGDGHGGFPHALTLPVPSGEDWPVGVLFAGDVNRDGKLDVVFARPGGWGVLLNTCQ